MIFKYQLGQLQTNCYFLVKENNCLIIDPADDASFILEELQRRKLNLVGILATHGHFDHLLAIGEIQQSINVPLYICQKDLFLIDRMEETAEHFLGYKPVTLPIKNVKNFNFKNLLQISNFKFQIIFSPGHTPGGCSFYLSEEKIVFSGDTLFKEGIGRYDFSYCNKADLKKSLEKLLKLPKNTKVYPGHGEETTINNELNILSSFSL